MNDLRGQSAAHQKHLEALKARHMALSTQIEEEQKSPAASPHMLRMLKAKKLRLKDEIERKAVS